MVIKDNGDSFNVAKLIRTDNPKRLGLVGMRERIEMLGGHLTIKSAVGHGTTLRIEIPYSLPSPVA
jgi:two-component system sensor histidine kinase DegS